MYKFIVLTPEEAESVKTDRIVPIKAVGGFYVLPIKLVEKHPDLNRFDKIEDFEPDTENIPNTI